MISKLVQLLACTSTFVHAATVKCPYSDALEAKEAKAASKELEIDLAQVNCPYMDAMKAQEAKTDSEEFLLAQKKKGKGKKGKGKGKGKGKDKKTRTGKKKGMAKRKNTSLNPIDAMIKEQEKDLKKAWTDVAGKSENKKVKKSKKSKKGKQTVSPAFSSREELEAWKAARGRKGNAKKNGKGKKAGKKGGKKGGKNGKRSQRK